MKLNKREERKLREYFQVTYVYTWHKKYQKYADEAYENLTDTQRGQMYNYMNSKMAWE